MVLWLTVFAVSVLLLVYTFVGYPVAMWIWSRLWPRPTAPLPGWQPKVAMIVVAHNEGRRIVDKLRSCLAQDYPQQHLHLVVVSDGSTDDTVQQVMSLDSQRVSLIELAQRGGKAHGLNQAVAHCDEEVLVFTDARQRLNREAVSSLVHALSDPRMAVVSGELMFRADGRGDMADGGFAHGIDAYWRYEKFIRKAEAAVHSTAGATGALYALRRSVFRPIPTHTILDDVLIPMQACLAGGRVIFESGALAFDTPSQDIAAERRRKVRTLAGNFQLVALMPELLLPWRNPIFVQFVSHKLLRLLAPWAMLAVLVSSAVLAVHAPLFAVFLAVQLLAYGLVLAGSLWPVILRWKLIRLLQAFVALNAFAVLGLLEFFMNRRAHLWSSSTVGEGGGRQS
jgi:poly-beta-1,6-N-acetyl-D-glucosamine synthase